MLTEFSLTWKPLPEAQTHVSYGHDLTAVWMLSELGKQLGNLPEADVELLTRLGTLAMERAYDTKLGGFFEYGSDDGTVQGRYVCVCVCVCVCVFFPGFLGWGRRGFGFFGGGGEGGRRGPWIVCEGV